jgi:F-type H+-transporting ATPase subunit delta
MSRSENLQDTALDPGITRSRLVQVYAEALLAAAADAGRVEEVGGELSDLVDSVFAANPAIEAYLISPAVGRRAKTQALEDALSGRVSDLVRNMVAVLNKNGRLGIVRAIAAAYRDLLEQRAGRVRVKVVSAVPLSDDQRRRLTETLAARLKQSPVLSVSVDPNLLGGLVVRVGDQVFDTSVRTRLETLRNQLLEQGSSYVLHTNQG